MNKLITILCILVVSTSYAQDNNQIVIGTKDELFSKILNENREFWVKLPESYYEDDALNKKYPILVVLDGDVHFNPISTMTHYMSSIGRIPEMIIVGIKNIDRRHDYTPDKIVTVRENNSGGGRKFLRFLEQELIPALDLQYRTSTDRILYGHSLGGLLTTHAYMQEKSAFKAFIAVDPSFGTWDAETMDNKLDSVTNEIFGRFIYIATANWGKRNIRNRDRHIRLYESLNNKCEGEFSAKLEYFENENHRSVPLVAFNNGISTIFEDYEISK